VTDDAIQTAFRDKLPIRVVVQKEKIPGQYETVWKRLLDPISWGVTNYNSGNGQCVLSRGVNVGIEFPVQIENAVDDLSDVPDGNQFPDRAKVVGCVIKRDNRVRAYVLKRAKGRCEYCKVQGFPTANGGFYLEAHHIISLCDAGRDTVENVIALCPQHHRQAHYGADAETLESRFIKILNKQTA
jgi:5-methylcytosine-specific restriction protein A